MPNSKQIKIDYDTVIKDTEKLLSVLEASEGEPLFNDLNKLYNYRHMAEEDSSLMAKMRECGGGDLCLLIDEFFKRYTAKLGVDIRESLYTLSENDLNVYFKDVTEFNDGGDAISYKAGDDVHFKVQLREKSTDSIVSCDSFIYNYEIDGISGKKEGKLPGETGVFELVIPAEEISKSTTLQNGRGAFIRLDITATSSKDVLKFEGNSIGGVPTGYRGGAIIDLCKVKPTNEMPKDLVSFWKSQFQRLDMISPTDETKPTEKTRYTANFEGVEIANETNHSNPDTYNIDLTNYFQIRKFDSALSEVYRTAGLRYLTEDQLNSYDVYELSLKCLGPTPATGILAIPKNIDTPVDVTFVYDGYSAFAPAIMTSREHIYFHLSHHGYKNGKPRIEKAPKESKEDFYYNLFYNDGPINYYGKGGNARKNHSYKDKTDCYMLYLLLRNLQAVRFINDSKRLKDLSSVKNEALKDLYTSLASSFNGIINLQGGSMGGYQALGVAGLSELYGIDITYVNATWPAFCNLAGHTVENRINNIFGIGYEANMDYFDPVFISQFIKAETNIGICGLGDYTCPPSTVVATYNSIKAKKQITFYQASQHGYITQKKLNGELLNLNPVYNRASDN